MYKWLESERMDLSNISSEQVTNVRGLAVKSTSPQRSLEIEDFIFFMGWQGVFHFLRQQIPGDYGENTL